MYQAELQGPAAAPLRFSVPIQKGKADSELFANLPLGDVWFEADLLNDFEYLYRCKHTRTAALQIMWVLWVASRALTSLAGSQMTGWSP